MNNLSNGLSAGDICLTAAGLSNGTTTTHTVGNALTYVIDGEFKAKAAASNAATPTLDAMTGMAFKAVAASQKCMYLFLVNAAGDVGVIQGEVIDDDEQYGARSPMPASGWALIGTVEVAAASTYAGQFVMGVTNLSGVTGLTYTWTDRMAVEAQP